MKIESKKKEKNVDTLINNNSDAIKDKKINKDYSINK